MNPFRSRKKSFAEGEGKSRPSLDNAPAVPSLGSRGLTFRKNKKAAPEPKPELDLENVLPSSDDFRTSLLMPNLSARFSMLREQDDPSSKLGKANDDSVLYPRRHSKLGLFSPEGLSDIAEVSSISGSIRPPFANDRIHSFASDGDGYGTDDGSHASIMTRAKPGQGNKFFGGRQIVYKVTADAAPRGEPGVRAEKPMGKAMYEDDIALSAFQRMRLERKQQEREELEASDRSSGENDRSGSPPLAGYNRNRETGSSTNSHPDGRTSTAATSIVSQPGATWYASGTSSLGKSSPVTTPGLERPNKGKRLYGQGLDQQMMEQQSSAVNRLNSIQKNGRGGPGNMGLSRSASNLNERFQRSGPFSPGSGTGSGNQSPAPQSAGLGGFDFGVNGPSRSGSHDRAAGMKDTPPMTPASPLGDPTLVASLDANDFGKATASGAFNKPKTQYNEQQYAQRQLQLQEGRETPPLRSFSRQDQQSEYSGRLRNGSMASVQSTHSSQKQYRTGQSSRAESSASNHKHQQPHLESNPTANGTYFADNSGSEYGSHPNSPEPVRRNQPTQKPGSSDGNLGRSTIYEHDDQHPAFRNQPNHLYIEPSDSEEENYSRGPHFQKGNKNLNDDSPTLGPIETNENQGGGLSDLVKGHLRNYSNASSVYPDNPDDDKENSDDGHWVGRAPTSNPTGRPSLENAIPPPLGLPNRARQVLEQATALANANAKAHDVLGGVGTDKIQQVLGPEVPRRSNDSAAAWQEQLRGHHNRGGSTETQKEREHFANELADRRKLVEEKLKSFTEESQRSNDTSPAKGPFNLLKKSSHGSLVRANEDSKAAKMLGMGNNNVPDQRGSRPESSDREGSTSRDRSIGADRRDKFFRRGASNPAQDAISKFNSSDAAPPPPPAPFGFQRSRTDPANQPVSYHPAGRSRKYSPPRTTTIAPGADLPAQSNMAPPPAPNPNNNSEPNSRTNSAMGNRSASGKVQQPVSSYFPPPSLPVSTPQQSASNPATPNPQSIGFPSLNNPRPSPAAPGYSAHTTPPLELPPHMQQAAPAPTMISSPPHSSSSGSLGRRAGRKQSVNKQDISEPTFVSGTSSVITVDLPPGASLSNGMSASEEGYGRGAPPVPPINPRRRGGGGAKPTRDLFSAFGGRGPASAGAAGESEFEEKSSWDGDDDGHESGRNGFARRLRKISSESGGLTGPGDRMDRERARGDRAARHAALMSG